MNGFAGYPGANTSTTDQSCADRSDIAGAGCVAGAATPGLCVLSSSPTPTNNATWAAGVPDTLWCRKTRPHGGRLCDRRRQRLGMPPQRTRLSRRFTSATPITTPADNGGLQLPQQFGHLHQLRNAAVQVHHADHGLRLSVSTTRFRTSSSARCSHRLGHVRLRYQSGLRLPPSTFAMPPAARRTGSTRRHSRASISRRQDVG